MSSDKISFWVKVTGWSGLISASGAITLYQLTNNWMFLISTVIIVLFSAYALSTSKDVIWRNKDRVFWILMFSIFFVSLLQSIFVLIIYFKSKKHAK